MDRSASIRVAPEPCRSGDIEISGKSPENSGDVFRQHYPSALAAASCNGRPGQRLQAILHGAPELAAADRREALEQLGEATEWLRRAKP
jgi:hypothetical protein